MNEQEFNELVGKAVERIKEHPVATSGPKKFFALPYLVVSRGESQEITAENATIAMRLAKKLVADAFGDGAAFRLFVEVKGSPAYGRDQR